MVDGCYRLCINHAGCGFVAVRAVAAMRMLTTAGDLLWSAVYLSGLGWRYFGLRTGKG